MVTGRSPSQGRAKLVLARPLFSAAACRAQGIRSKLRREASECLKTPSLSEVVRFLTFDLTGVYDFTLPGREGRGGVSDDAGRVRCGSETLSQHRSTLPSLRSTLASREGFVLTWRPLIS